MDAARILFSPYGPHEELIPVGIGALASLLILGLMGVLSFLNADENTPSLRKEHITVIR